MKKILEDYPAGVQCLLKDAAWHLEQLDDLEREFRAWEEARSWPKDAPGPEVLLSTPSRAEQARARWEARARAVGGELL